MQTEQERMWDLLKGTPQRMAAEYKEYYSRNPPRPLRPWWQKLLIVGVPVIAIIALITMLLL
jgi:hypothetical protein